jgi:outer membrane protein assembly factor BamA
MNFKQTLFILVLFIQAAFAAVDYSSIVSEIKIEGLKHITTHNLTDIHFKSIVGSRLNEKNVINDLQALYLSGYFNTVSVETQPSTNSVSLLFKVVENPKIQDVLLHGNTQFKSKKLLDSLYHQPGKILNFGHLEKDKNTILDYYKNEGFDLFQISEITFTTPNIDIFIEEIIVDKIRFNGLENIPPFIIQREMDLKEGDGFNSLTIRKDRERLLKLGYFSDISVPKLIKGPHKNSLIIELDFKEKKSNKIDIGLEQEEEQFVGFFKLLKNHVFIDSDILSGKVQIGNLEGSQLGVNSYSATYFQPWFLNKYNTDFQLTFYDDINQELLSTNLSDNTDTELSSRKGYTTSFGKNIFSEKVTFKVGYQQEFVEPVEESTVSSYILNSLIYDLSYTSTTDFFNPQKGSYWNLRYEQGGNKAFLNLPGLSYSRSILNAATFIKLSPRLVWGIHGNAGVFDTSETSVSYETESFVIGGANTLRGYKDTDYPFSGSRKLLFNTELRYTLTQSVQLVFFYDTGSANDSNDFNLSDMHSGKGIGARFFTPVGPLRLDLAFSNQTFIHFGIGQVF